jgi:hypothetical protein
MTKKYGGSVSLGSKLTIFGKTYGFGAKVWFFKKTCKNAYMGPLCISNPLYGDPDQEI